MTADANSQSVNLAQKLSDEAVIYVAKKGKMFQRLEVQKVLQLRQHQQKKQARSI